MRVVIDTNVLVSALLHGRSLPFQLIALWRQGKVTLITSAEQLEEIRRVTRYPKLRARLNPAVAGRLVNELKGSAIVIDNLPDVSVSPDPWDTYLLATIEIGRAHVRTPVTNAQRVCRLLLANKQQKIKHHKYV